MRILPCALPVALFAMGGLVQAGDGDWYLQFAGGMTITDDSEGAPGGAIEFDEGFNVSAAVGRSLFSLGDHAKFALEFEGYHSDQDVDDDGLLLFGSSSMEDLTFFAIFVNGIIEWQWSPRTTFYGGVGVGYAPTVELQSLGDSVLGNSFSEDDGDALAWQGKLGLRYDLGGPLSWHLGYRYLQLEDVSFTDSVLNESFDLETAQHAFEIGFRWGAR